MASFKPTDLDPAKIAAVHEQVKCFASEVECLVATLGRLPGLTTLDNANSSAPSPTLSASE